MDTVVGFIGLGTMGMPMVRNLSKAGARVVVYDADPAACARAAELAGVEAAANPREVAGRCAVLISCLPDDKAVDAVYRGEEGVLQGAGEGLITCDFSTVSPGFTRALNAELAGKKITHFEAPMLGSKPQAEAGEVFLILAGGEEGRIAELAPVLDVVGRKHMYVGPSGMGNTIKLVHNALGAMNYCAVAEALGICAAAGVDLNTFYEVVRAGSGMAYGNYFERKVPTILQGDYSPRFRLALAHKDAGLAAALAEEAGAPAAILTETLSQLGEAMADGHGEEDASAVTRVMEKRIGRPISGKPA